MLENVRYAQMQLFTLTLFLLLGWTLLSQMFVTIYLAWLDAMHIIVEHYMILQNRKISGVQDITSHIVMRVSTYFTLFISKWDVRIHYKPMLHQF